MCLPHNRADCKACCPYCRGIGKVYKRTASDRITATVPCPVCGIKQIAQNLQSVYPLPAHWQDVTLDSIAPGVEGEERMIAQAKRYSRAPKGWFVVQGMSGNAKTLSLVAILNACKSRGLSALFLPAREIANLFFYARDYERGAVDSGWSTKKLHEDLRSVQLLVVDELDKVDWTNSYICDQLFLMFNARHEHIALTAIAFNDEHKLPDAMLSRLRDGRWGDGAGDGIIRNTAKDQRPYLQSLWADEVLKDPRTGEVIG